MCNTLNIFYEKDLKLERFDIGNIQRNFNVPLSAEVLMVNFSSSDTPEFIDFIEVWVRLRRFLGIIGYFCYIPGLNREFFQSNDNKLCISFVTKIHFS